MTWGNSAALFLTLACASLSALAGENDAQSPVQESACARIGTEVEKLADHLLPRQGYRVVGTGRLHFHTAPLPSCRTETFIVPSDLVIAYDELDGWVYVMYINPRHGTGHGGMGAFGSTGVHRDDERNLGGPIALPIRRSLHICRRTAT
jgi:hypothetical protein